MKLYEILLMAAWLSLLFMAAAVLGAWLYRKGLHIGLQLSAKDLERVLEETGGEKDEAPAPAPTREDIQLATVLANIDSYDGTGNGQREVPAWTTEP